MTALLDAALRYAARGWYVFPVDGKGNHYTGKGHKIATVDEQKIRDWWARWPTANIGVWLRKSGLIAIDVDVDGKPGRRTLANLEGKYGALPRTCHQRSGSGGEHFIMLDPSGDPDSGSPVRGNFGKGSAVDIKCNGYVVVAPSRTTKGGYEWVSDGVPQAVPAKWRPQLKPKADGHGGDVAAWDTTQDVGRDVRELAEALRKIGPRGDGGTMFRAISTIFEDFGLSIDDGWPYLVEWNARRDEPLADGALMRQIDRVGAKRAGTGARWRVKVRPKQASAARIDLVCMADVEPEVVEWLWHGRIPLGTVTVIDGDPGLGKSTVIADLAARVTTGAPMPNETARREPAAVVILTAEDHLASTVRPRLDAAQADVRRVHVLRGIVSENGEKDLPCLPTNFDELREAIRRSGAQLVAVDPLMSYLGDDVDSHKDQAMRRLVMAPLTRLAEETGTAIVVLRHLRKMGGSAINRGGGTIGITAAARSALMFGRDPDDDDSCLIACTKSNLARHPPTLRYRIVDADNKCGRVEWLGEANGVTADHLVGHSTPTRTDDASKWLADFLADGKMESTRVKAGAEARGYTERVLRDARDKLRVVTKRVGKAGRNQVSWWSLPDNSRTESMRGDS